VVRTESGQNHFHSSEISPKRGTTFSRQRQFMSNKINGLIHVRQRKVLKMGLKKLVLVDKDLTDYSLETVKMFYDDARAAGYKL
jgi:hypothetical protein